MKTLIIFLMLILVIVGIFYVILAYPYILVGIAIVAFLWCLWQLAVFLKDLKL